MSQARIDRVVLDSFGLEGRCLHVLREDLLHPVYGGNKWRKLRLNFEAARDTGHATVLTFGGAWSNHIHATAAACADVGLRCIGIIRGQEPADLSDTLIFARQSGMQLHFVSRSRYAEKNEAGFAGWVREQFGDVYVIPEGGSNVRGIMGCADILHEGCADFSVVACAMGTGTTATGLLMGATGDQRIAGFPALKGGEVLVREMGEQLNLLVGSDDLLQRFDLFPNAHRGGFARFDGGLVDFMRRFHRESGIPLDPVYTGKLAMGIIKAMGEGELPDDVLMVHSGGLQGVKGLERQLGERLYPC